VRDSPSKANGGRAEDDSTTLPATPHPGITGAAVESKSGGGRPVGVTLHRIDGPAGCAPARLTTRAQPRERPRPDKCLPGSTTPAHRPTPTSLQPDGKQGLTAERDQQAKLGCFTYLTKIHDRLESAEPDDLPSGRFKPGDLQQLPLDEQSPATSAGPGRPRRRSRTPPPTTAERAATRPPTHSCRQASQV
jgi:hypothetical protein